MMHRKSTAFLADVTRLSPPADFEERAWGRGYPTSCATLLSFTQICFVFISCVQRRVVEGSVGVHGEWAMLWVAAMYKVTKRFSEWKRACRNETLKNDQTRREWHHNTSTPSLHLVPFLPPLTQRCFVCLLVVCRGLWKAVCWVVLGVHVDVHGEWVMLWVVAMYNVLAVLYWAWQIRMVSLACMQKLWSQWAVLAGSVWYVCRNCGVHEQC